jgi:hypothetical protein
VPRQLLAGRVIERDKGNQALAQPLADLTDEVDGLSLYGNEVAVGGRIRAVETMESRPDEPAGTSPGYGHAA